MTQGDFELGEQGVRIEEDLTAALDNYIHTHYSNITPPPNAARIDKLFYSESLLETLKAYYVRTGEYRIDAPERGCVSVRGQGQGRRAREDVIMILKFNRNDVELHTDRIVKLTEDLPEGLLSNEGSTTTPVNYNIHLPGYIELRLINSKELEIDIAAGKEGLPPFINESNNTTDFDFRVKTHYRPIWFRMSSPYLNDLIDKTNIGNFAGHLGKSTAFYVSEGISTGVPLIVTTEALYTPSETVGGSGTEVGASVKSLNKKNTKFTFGIPGLRGYGKRANLGGPNRFFFVREGENGRWYEKPMLRGDNNDVKNDLDLNAEAKKAWKAARESKSDKDASESESVKVPHEEEKSSHYPSIYSSATTWWPHYGESTRYSLNGNNNNIDCDSYELLNKRFNIYKIQYELHQMHKTNHIIPGRYSQESFERIKGYVEQAMRSRKHDIREWGERAATQENAHAQYMLRLQNTGGAPAAVLPKFLKKGGHRHLQYRKKTRKRKSKKVMRKSKNSMRKSKKGMRKSKKDMRKSKKRRIIKKNKMNN